jgi:hypothetical protein
MIHVLLDDLERGFRETGLEVPGWISELRAEIM